MYRDALFHIQRGQEDELCAGVSDGAAHLLALVAAEIVEDDDIARLEGGSSYCADALARPATSNNAFSKIH